MKKLFLQRSHIYIHRFKEEKVEDCGREDTT